MKRIKLSKLAIIASLLTAGFTGAGQVSQSATMVPTQQSQQVRELKGTEPRRQAYKRSVIQHSGGLDIVQDSGNYGMSPKEYGMRFGNGNSRKVKHNRLRYSHNAKLKRRK